MSVQFIGALVGLAVALVDITALMILAKRVELEDTKKVLRVTGLVQLVFLPVLGWFAAPFVVGD